MVTSWPSDPTTTTSISTLWQKMGGSTVEWGSARWAPVFIIPPHPLFQVPFCFTFIFSSLLSSAFQCFLDVCLQKTGKVINNNPQSHTLLRLCINISRIIYSSWIPILTPLWKYCEVCVAVCVWDAFLNFSNFSQGHSSFITHLDWSVDSQYLVSNSGDYEILYCKSLILRFPLG